MTEFAETAMRKICRNPKCRSKLPKPVSNPWEAFCVRGCYLGFYRTRCLVCEAKMERKTGNQLVAANASAATLCRPILASAATMRRRRQS
jgi:hypothetical protein